MVLRILTVVGIAWTIAACGNDTRISGPDVQVRCFALEQVGGTTVNVDCPGPTTTTTTTTGGGG